MKIKIPKPPLCPFCGRPIPKPGYLPFSFSDHEGGLCECGAVFVLDETGFSRGSAFLSALYSACAGDTELALSLIPDEDYQEIWIENYDPVTHKVIGEPIYEGRKIRGALCFLKLTEDLEDLKGKERKKIFSKEEDLLQIDLDKFKKRLSRTEAERLLLEDKMEELLYFTLAEPLNLNTLQKLLYHPDETLRKKTAYLLGLSAGHLVKREPQRIHDLIRRLLYASADSAASPWGALEAVGEILRETGETFDYFVKNLLAFLLYPEYETSTLYALLRIAEKNPSSLKRGPYLRLLSLFPKGKPLSQALIIKIFIHLESPELLSYKKYLKPERVKLYDYQNFTLKEEDIKNLWKDYEKTLKKE